MSLQQTSDSKLPASAQQVRAAQRQASPGRSLDALPPALLRAIQLAEAGDCLAALQALRPLGHAPEVTNAVGVCLMRLGRTDEAVNLYRGMVMKAGCTWMRPEARTLYKFNFATALLLSGTPAGCLSALSDIDQPDHPSAQRLYAAIQKWQAELPFWRRWDWRINHVEPPKCHVTLDFQPGAFTDEA